MGAEVALVRAGVVFGGIADAEANIPRDPGFVGEDAGWVSFKVFAWLEIWVGLWAKAGHTLRLADSDRLKAISARYLGFQSGKTFMRLFISCSSIQSSSIAAEARAASSYNLLTL